MSLTGECCRKAESEYGDQKAIDWAGQFLNRKHEKPFFLAVGLWHPHIPLFAPQKYFDMYPADKVRLPQEPADDLDDIPAIGQKFAAFRRDEHERIVRERQVERRHSGLPREHLVCRRDGGTHAEAAR